MTGIAESFLSPLQGISGILQSERHHKDKSFDDALLAIKAMLLETKKHLELASPERDRAKEYKSSVCSRSISRNKVNLISSMKAVLFLLLLTLLAIGHTESNDYSGIELLADRNAHINVVERNEVNKPISIGSCAGFATTNSAAATTRYNFRGNGMKNRFIPDMTQQQRAANNQ